VLDLQRDALLAAGITDEHLYEDQGSGRRDAKAPRSTPRPRLASLCSASSRRSPNRGARRIAALAEFERAMIN
jgi:DNA invertase Pin-like site-specific DNA recombinase